MAASFIHGIEEALLAKIETDLGVGSTVYPTPGYLQLRFVGRAAGRHIPILLSLTGAHKRLPSPSHSSQPAVGWWQAAGSIAEALWSAAAHRHLAPNGVISLEVPVVAHGRIDGYERVGIAREHRYEVCHGCCDAGLRCPTCHGGDSR